MTTYKTLLLAVMVAGAATIASEAHAQSNTERLVSINENTDSILDIVTVISNALASIQESVDTLTSDMSTVTESSARVESAISGFGPTLNSIVTGVQLNAATLNDLSNIMAGMSTDIASIQASLVEGGDGGLAQSIDLLTSTVNRNEITTSDRLDAIEAAISSLEAKIDDDSSSTFVPTAGFAQDSVTYDVTTYTYKSQGEKRTTSGTNVYELDLTFSCNGQVHINKVSTDISNSVTWIITNSFPTSTTPENYLKVDERELYSSKFEISRNQYIVYTPEVSLSKTLSSGQTLNFESRQTERGTEISDASRTVYQRGYTITVDYFGDRSTVCSFGGTSSTGTGSLPKSSDLLLAPTVVAGSNSINTFSVDVTCGGDPVEITGMTATVTDGWSESLAGFAKFKLTHLGSNDVVDIGFTRDGTLMPYNYPIEFHSEDIRVSGTIASSDDVRLLIELDYNTVAGGSCEKK